MVGCRFGTDLLQDAEHTIMEQAVQIVGQSQSASEIHSSDKTRRVVEAVAKPEPDLRKLALALLEVARDMQTEEQEKAA